MGSQRGVWIKRGGSLVFIIVVIFILFKTGVFKSMSAEQTVKEKKVISITTSYSGEGMLEVVAGETLLISGNGKVDVTAGSKLKIRLSCKDNNLIDNIKINGDEQEFDKSQFHEIEITDIKKELFIEAGFISCSSIVIEQADSYQLRVLGAEYSCKGKEENQNSYFYCGQQIELKLQPEKYWMLKGVHIDNQVYTPEQLTSLVCENGEYSLVVAKDSVAKISFTLTKEKIPVTIEYGKGQVMINGKAVENGQEIDRCDEYQLIYSVPQDNVIVNNIYCNSSKVALTEEDYFTKYTGKINDTNTSLTIMILEQKCDIVQSYRQYFDLSKLKKIVTWTEKYNTVYIKENTISLTCKDNGIINNIACNSSVTRNEKNLSITAPAVIHKIAIRKDPCFYLSKTPLTFIYDASAPSIVDYSIAAQSTSQTEPSTLDITVKAKDTGEAGVDQILYGSYEEYQQWVGKINSGEYESLHEKEEENVAFTFSNQTILLDQEYYVWAIDCAANISEPVKMDLQGPELTCNTKEIWYNKDISVTGQANEEIQSVFVSASYEDFLEHTIKQETSTSVVNKQDHENAKSRRNTWTFTIAAKENKEEKYYVWAYDTHGNKSATPCTYQAKIDVVEPELQLSRNFPERQWSKEVILLTMVAKDEKEKVNSGVGKVYYSAKSDRSGAVEVTSKNEEGQYVLRTPTDKNGKPIAIDQKYNFWVEDVAGNVSGIEKTTIQIDSENPRITSVKLRAVEDKSKVNMTPYGICCKKDVVLTVQAKDDGISSGLDSMELYQNGNLISKAAGSDGIYSFTLRSPFAGELSLRVGDKAGNTSEIQTIAQIDSTIPSSVLKLENEVPEITFHTPFSNYIDTEGRKWFSEDVNVTLDCQDKGSGVEEVRLWVNEFELLQDSNGNPLGKVTWQETTLNYLISTSKLMPKEDGSYHIKVQVTDYCGNSTVAKQVIYLDKEKPVIGQVVFTSQGNSVSQSDMVKKDTYGYYFKAKTKVRIQAKDSKASAGVAKIAYYTVDYGVDSKGIKSQIKVENVDVDGGIEFVLASGFKGQIYAMAIDLVGHNSEGYSKPYGVIIESIEANSQTANAQFTMPATAYADAKGQPLYQEDVELFFTAEDYFNGIEKVEWKVTSPQDTDKNQAGVIEVDASGNIKGVEVNKADIKRDTNLVTSLKHRLTIQNNSNDITMDLKITDRSGNIFNKKMVFSIDRKQPTINVSVSEQKDAKNLAYYDKGPLVHIQVKERNFDPSLVTYTIQNDSGRTYKIKSWSKKENPVNPDETMYVANVECKEDGEYSLEFQLKDLAGNSSTVAKQSFVVDTCSPKVKMSFAGENDILESKAFYNSGQSMVVAIEEHNFSPEETTVTWKRYANSSKSKLLKESVVSSFHTERDQHIATMKLKENGWYLVEVTCRDKAGNTLQTEAVTEFGIDDTSPVIQIEGVNDQAAYNDTVIPTIHILDENYDSDKVKIHLTGSKMGEQILLFDSEGRVQTPNKEKKVSLPDIASASIKREEDYHGDTGLLYKGHCIVLDCFPKEQDMDDIYTLLVEAEDVAGNRSTRKVDFSVNRFGSVYVFSNQLLSVSGSYLQTVGDVIITETNVNTLVNEETQIKLSFNGVVKDLVENIDYTVEHISSSKQWNQYTYIIKGDLFLEEGRYTVLVHSKDASGNVNENDLEAKGAQLEFGVDRTQPIITATNIEKNTTYGETSKTAKLYISDNIALEQANIYINDEKVEYIKENEIYEFVIGDSNEEQNLRIVAIDKAGNETVQKIEHIYVTTSLWVRFWNNHLLVVLTGIGIVLLLMGLVYVLFHRKTKPCGELTLES